MRRSLCSVLAAVTVAVATLPRATAFTAPAALTRAFGGQAAAMSPGRLIRGSGANAVALGRVGLRGRAGGLQLRMRDVGSSADAAAFMLAPIAGDELVGMVADNGEGYLAHKKRPPP
ncbi:hypothetical protein T484DRAFT_1836163 [Baffinella frigidus]|nr:hypothetical protein T484DRAFT_1836163 [Cryptophyta sp. CCMP2293]